MKRRAKRSMRGIRGFEQGEGWKVKRRAMRAKRRGIRDQKTVTNIQN